MEVLAQQLRIAQLPSVKCPQHGCTHQGRRRFVQLQLMFQGDGQVGHHKNQNKDKFHG